jgi:hypothetical protein
LADSGIRRQSLESLKLAHSMHNSSALNVNGVIR